MELSGRPPHADIHAQSLCMWGDCVTRCMSSRSHCCHLETLGNDSGATRRDTGVPASSGGQWQVGSEVGRQGLPPFMQLADKRLGTVTVEGIGSEAESKPVCQGLRAHGEDSVKPAWTCSLPRGSQRGDTLLGTSQAHFPCDRLRGICGQHSLLSASLPSVTLTAHTAYRAWYIFYLFVFCLPPLQGKLHKSRLFSAFYA